MSNLIEQLNEAMFSTVENVRRSLVRVHNGRQGYGAGTVWHADGLIITNAHVVSRDHINVTLAEGQTLPAHLLAYDKALDLAALSVEAQNLPTIALGNARTLQPGTWVMALGHPWGVQGAVSAGVVIDVGVPPELPARGEFVQVGLQLRPGHSGGPLVDGQGRLVGINTMITGPEVGLAVPVHVIKRFLRERLGSPDLVFV
jgi:S1-C subfamily serine protease